MAVHHIRSGSVGDENVRSKCEEDVKMETVTLMVKR
jgi:hypothetical protein